MVFSLNSYRLLVSVILNKSEDLSRSYSETIRLLLRVTLKNFQSTWRENHLVKIRIPDHFYRKMLYDQD